MRAQGPGSGATLSEREGCVWCAGEGVGFGRLEAGAERWDRGDGTSLSLLAQLGAREFDQ